MRAIILAAGMGKRTRDYGEEKPKCLFEFKGKTTLEHQLDALKENGVRDVVMVVGYKKEMIKNFIENSSSAKEMNITLVENPEYDSTNTSYSWWLAKDYLKDEDSVIHFNSDLIFFPELIKRLIDEKSENIVFIDKKIELNDSMEQVILDEDSKVLHMDKANVVGAHGKGVGVSKFSQKAVDFMIDKMDEFILDKGDKGQNFYGMIRLAVKELDFHGLDLGNSFFREYNSAEDYDVAKENYEKQSFSSSLRGTSQNHDYDEFSKEKYAGLNKEARGIKAVILAAGKGSRLKHYTDNVPTALLMIDNKPILEYQLNALKENGVRDVVMIVGYKGFMIKDFIKGHSEYNDMKITYVENDEYVSSGTAYSWWLAKDFIKGEDRILHLHSDLVFSPDLIKKILDSEKENVILVDNKVELNDSMEQVILDGDEKILYMDKRNVSGSHGKAVGIAKFSGSAIEYMINRIGAYLGIGDREQAFYGIIRKAITDHDFFGLKMGDSYFMEYNTKEDYETKKEAVIKRSPPERASVIMMYGFPSTGKTTVSRKLRDYFEREVNVDVLSTFKIRQDHELLDLNSDEQRDKAYKLLAESLDKKIKQGVVKCIILDGNFNRKSRRQQVYDIVRKYGCELHFVKCEVTNISEIKKRLEERKRYDGFVEHQASTIDLYRMIQQTGDPLAEEELENSSVLVTMNTESNEASLIPTSFIGNGILKALGK